MVRFEKREPTDDNRAEISHTFIYLTPGFRLPL